MTEDLITDELTKAGWWKCKYCSTDKWDVYHQPDENTCSETGKSREEAEEKKG